MKKKDFIQGVAALSLTMLIIQSMSMGFSVYVSSKLGSSQMGLFHLVMSVYSFALTLATSGIPLAATPLVSEAHSYTSAGGVVKKCVMLALCFGMLSGAATFFSAEKIAVAILKERRCAVPLKILAAALPFISVSGAVRGYFTGRQKVSAITASRMTEEFSYIFIMLALMKVLGTEQTGVLICALSIAASGIIACFVDAAMLAYSGRRSAVYTKSTGGIKSVLSISMPVAAGSYLRSGLVAAENLIIPPSLSKFGAANALSDYGTVKAMAMPVITFPYVFLQSLTSLLVPEVSSRSAKENKKSVLRAAKKALLCTFIFALAIGVFLLLFGKYLGRRFYSSADAGAYITALSLLTIPMYIDTVTDSLLKGLNQQVYSLKINIIDSFLRVPAIYLLLPFTGIYGYIAILYGSELLNLALSFKRLKKIL